jgi:integrase/recombinase XerD
MTLRQSESRTLTLYSIDTSTISGLRDRALIATMIFSFARVSAVIGMDTDDFYPEGKAWWLRLREKGGKTHTVPAHHKTVEFMDAYMAAADLEAQKGIPDHWQNEDLSASESAVKP